jgi:membrane-bound ClpP family serine protease
MTAEDLIGIVFVLTMVFGMPLAFHRFTVKFHPENVERSRWTMTFAAIGLAIVVGFPMVVVKSVRSAKQAETFSCRHRRSA